MTDAERIAQKFHEAYEALAPEHGYKTRERSAVPWEDVPADNKALMIATVQNLLDYGIFTPNEPTSDRLLNAQAELQTALGFHRLAMSAEFTTSDEYEYIEMRLQACLAMLHSLMGDLGRPMYRPTQMPDDWTPA